MLMHILYFYGPVFIYITGKRNIRCPGPGALATVSLYVAQFSVHNEHSPVAKGFVHRTSSGPKTSNSLFPNLFTGFGQSWASGLVLGQQVFIILHAWGLWGDDEYRHPGSHRLLA